MSDDERAVTEANEAFYAAFRARDYAAMERAWVTGPEAFCVHPGWDVIRGRAQVLDSWRRILSSPRAPDIACSRVRVALFGDLAIVTCREGFEGQPGALVATNVFVRQSDGWRMLHHHAGPVAPSERSAPDELLN